jgi:DNA-binding NarL/FixJ family response regulator
MIRVLIVDQIPLFCHVLAAVVEDEPDMQVVGCTTSVDEALHLSSNLDVILVNTRMSNGSALQLIRSVSEAELPTKVLALGLTESKEQILHYVQAGASGYVLKDDTVDSLLEWIRGVHAGQVRISPRIASAMMARLSESAQ